jgi:aminoglycoside phosphotransferase (APT) family kinase protein
MSFPPPETIAVSAAALDAILTRHGLHPRTVVPLVHGGSGHSVYLLGDDLVLRVPRNHPLWVEAPRQEAHILPIVRPTGVRMPDLVVFDDACDLLPVPYTIYTRVPGVALYGLDWEPATVPHVWRELGHDLALLHTGVSTDGLAQPLWPLEPPDNPDPRPWMEALAGAGVFPGPEAHWLRDWLDEITPRASVPLPLRFIHGDVQTMNIMVRPDPPTYAALLDWASARWDMPARDFWAVPLRAVPWMLEGYRAVAPGADEATAEWLIAWSHAQYGLYFLWRDQQAGTLPPASRVRRLLDGLHAFLTQ